MILETAAAIWCGCTGFIGLVHFYESLMHKIESREMSLTNFEDIIDKFFLACVREIKVWYPTLPVEGLNLYSVNKAKSGSNCWEFEFRFDNVMLSRILKIRLICAENYDNKKLVHIVENVKINKDNA